MSIVNSTVVIYKDCKITPDRNFLVDNITDYLQQIRTIGAQTLTDFQYIEHALNLTITLNAESATWLNPHSTATRYNYCSIQNDSDSFPIYYFIVDKHWTAKKTVTLSLVMDTINSFRVGTDYTLGDKTQVAREHKDRVYFGTVTYDGKTYYRRKIDFNSEGITPVLYKTGERIVREQGDNNNWYLMYLARNERTTATEAVPQAVNAYVLADNVLSVKTHDGAGFVLDLNSVSSTYYYFFGDKIEGSQTGQFRVENEVINIDSLMFFERTSDDELVLYRFTGQLISDRYLEYTEINRWNITNDLDVLFYNSRPLTYVRTGELSQILSHPWSTVGYWIDSRRSGKLSPESLGEVASIDAFYTIDRANTRILKLIMLPYSPFDVTFDSQGYLEAPAYLSAATVNWGTEDHPINKKYLYIAPDYIQAFENELNIPNTGADAIKVFQNLFTKIDLDSDVRDDTNESKLYHSDFYSNKFVYDSFSYPIQLENIDQRSLQFLAPNTPLEVNMVTTNTINSNFLFDFRNLGDYKTTEDYDHLLIVSRNNEVPLYNSEYINYIKNGYNYDKKSRIANNVQSAFGILGSAISLGSGITGVAGITNKWSSYFQSPVVYKADISSSDPNATIKERLAVKPQGNVGLESLYAAGQVASGIGGIVSGITSIIQNEQSFKQKQEQIKQSSVSVSGSDDLDLLKYYSTNKAKICEYSTSELMKEKLGDLFYYCGYDAGGEQKSPDLNTRKWFNYIQCTPEIKSTKNISQEIIDEIKNRWALGVTILHENNLLYDWDQTKANNERWLYI